MKFFAAGCRVSDRSCVEISGAGWSSLQQIAEHSGKGEYVFYHLD
jgi:hypothetical protein